MTVTIYHNPECGTSRNTLAMIRGAGIEPEIILYLQTPPSRERLAEMIAASGLTIRQAMRRNNPLYAEMDLGNEAVSDAQLLDAMMAHPILIERPLVVTDHGVRLCRPSEVLLDILPEALGVPFIKENGDVVIDANGKRVTGLRA